MMCFLMTVLGSWGVRNTASQPIYDCHDLDLSLNTFTKSNSTSCKLAD